MSNQLHRYRIVLDYIEPWLDEQDEATLKQIYADLVWWAGDSHPLRL